MADKELLYSVHFNIAQAKTSAQQLGAVFRRELQSVRIDLLDPRAFDTAIARTHALQAEMQQVATQAQRAAKDVQSIGSARLPAGGAGGGATGGLASGLLGGLVGYLSIRGARQITQQAGELSDLRTQAISTNAALTLLAGGGAKAVGAIVQIQSVAPGATNSLEAAGAAVTILTQKLPSAAISLRDISTFAAIVPRISASIRESGDAISQLTLFANSAAFQRADQLGVTADDVKQKMKELAAVFPELSDAQLKAAATVQLVNERFAPLAETLAQTVSGAQQLRTAWAELRTGLAEGAAGNLADQFLGGLAGGLNQLNVIVNGAQNLGAMQGALTQTLSDIQNAENRSLLTFIPGVQQSFDANEAAVQKTIEVVKQLGEGLAKGTPAAEQYQGEIADIVRSIVVWGSVSDEQVERIRQISAAMAEQQALGITTATPGAGAIEATKQAAQDLIDTFSQLDQMIASAGELGGQAPGIDQLQKQLISLKLEIATTGSVTDEQTAQMAALEGILQRAASGVQFLSTAEGQTAIATGGLNSALASTPGYLDAITLAAGQAASALQQALAIQGQVEGQLVSGLSGLISRGLITANAANQILQQQENLAARGANA
ncbi:MAG: hypothetical protein ACRETN_08310, partial [Nevskiales bacterium]